MNMPVVPRHALDRRTGLGARSDRTGREYHRRAGASGVQRDVGSVPRARVARGGWSGHDPRPWIRGGDARCAERGRDAIAAGWLDADCLPVQSCVGLDIRSVQASTDQLTFTPSSISAPVAVGRTINVEVQLRDRLGSAERHAGVTVALGQIVYEEQGDLAGEAAINGGLVGQSPITTMTDSRGIAHFSIRGDQALPAPVFFQAWIAPANGVPHSYSQQFAVQFIDSSQGQT